MPAGCVIAVDLGGSKLLGGVVDAELAVHHRSQRSVAGLEQSELLELVVAACRELVDAAEGEQEIVGAGFGIPCLVDRATGVAGSCVHLPLAGVRMADLMTERLGLRAFVDNDANCAAIAEHRAGAARGAHDAVVLTIGTGVGGGIVIDDRLYRGATGAGGELGHMVVDIDGPPCHGNCPNHGCLEAVASGSALGREGRRVAERTPGSALGRELANGREITGALVTELAHDGDRAARDVIALVGTRLGVGIANVVNVFNPEVVVVGGGVIAAGEMLLAPARQIVAERALAPSRDVVRVVPARFGAEAGMVGAALLAFEGLA